MSGMHHSIAALSRAGNCVLAEHVMVEPRWLEECAGLFSNLPAFFVGVRCELEVLVRREAARKDRTLGQARAQHPLVHAHGVYDFEVDSTHSSAEECARQIQRWLEEGAQPRAFKHLRQQKNLKSKI